jgi:manganese transport protein
MQLTFAVVPLVQFTGEKGKMGSFANSRGIQALSWTVAFVIGALNVWLLVEIFRAWL